MLQRFLYIDTYRCQWRSCNVLFVSSKQLYVLPSDKGRQQSFSMWAFWHFEANNSASRACNAHYHLHGNLGQSYGVRDLAGPTLLQANANSRPNLAHLKAPSEWAWLELLGKKRQGHTNTGAVRDTKCSHDISAWQIPKAELTLSSHFARVCP